MTMWYRIAQDDTKNPEIPQITESPKSSLGTKEATPEDIEFAKKLIEIKNLDKKSDQELEKIITSHKNTSFVIKKIAEGLNSLSKNIPFENLKPTFSQLSNEANQIAENYLTIVIAAEDKENQKSKAALTEIESKYGNIPTDLDSVIKLVKKLELKDYAYYGNLFGDLTNINPFISIVIKIIDYKATWIPKYESDVQKVKEFTDIYNSTNDPKVKKDSRIEIIKGISGILGVISNACIDIGALIIKVPGLQSVAATSLALGSVLQIASTLIQPNSPLNYQEISKLPGKLTDAVARISEGLPINESTIPEKRFPSVNEIREEARKQTKDPEERKFLILKKLNEQLQDPVEKPIYEGLEAEYKKIDNINWKNSYGTDKTLSILEQPNNVAMKFAKDTFGTKYFWFDDPSSVYYRNFIRYFNQLKTIVRKGSKEKDNVLQIQTPSKRSIGYQLVDSAIRNNMTNQFTAPLIREMANKYTAGNIYNFLNKKNVEINNLISSEARNANFAARFNVRPGSAGLDSLKVDIMNLKKILNTWK